MLKDHPTAEDVEGFLRSAPRQGMGPRNARVLRHVLASCSSCRHQLQAMGGSEQRLERLCRYPVDLEEQGAMEAAAPYDYSRAFAATEESLSAFFAEGKLTERTPEELLAELAPLPQEE